MRITGISIDGFGLFRDARVDELAPGLTIVAGENEAGKSTLVGFVRALLFGFPRKNTTERQYPPLAGGDEGGRLVLATDAGERWMVERYRGKGVRLTGPDGEVRSVEPASLLYPGVTRELFANIYAFGLDELQEVTSLQGDTQTAIFGAASGAAVTSLPKMYKAIETAGQALFKAGGAKPEINQLLAEIEGVRKRVADARKEVGEYEQCVALRAELDGQLTETQARLRDVGRTRQQVDARARMWTDWVALVESEQRLSAAVPVVETFPEDGLARLATFEAQLGDRRVALERARSEYARARDEQETLVVDAALLAAAPRIGEVSERRSSYVAALESRARDAVALEAAEAALAAALRGLGPDWTVERVRNVDRSLFTRDGIARFETLIVDAANDLTRARDQEEDRKRDAERAAGELNQAVARAAAAAASDGDDARDRVRELRAAMRGRDDVRSRREIAEQQLTSDNVSTNPRPVVPLTLVVIGAAVGVTLFATGRPLDGLIAVVAGVAIAIAVWISGRSRSSPTASLRATVDELAASEAAATRDVLRLWAAAGLSGEPSGDGLEAHLRELDQRDWARGEAERDVEKLRERMAVADEELLRAGIARDAAAQVAAEAGAAWSAWLEAHGLPESLQPLTARDAIAAFDECEARADERDRLRSAIEASDRDIGEFEAVAGEVFDGIGRARPDAGQYAGAVLTLAADAANAVQTNALRERSDARVAAAAAEAELAAKAHQATESEIRKLLDAGAASDAEEFRLRGRLYAERNELTDQMATRIASLALVTGTADRAELGEVFSGVSPETLDDEQERLARAEDELQAECDRLLRERADVDSTLARLASADTVASLRADEERLRERIRQSALVWSRHAVARFLLDEAKRRFEAERQPGVLREAARFFRTITGGRYVNILAPLDGGAIEVVDSDGTRKAADDLSRGSVEQLYLAIRFGYVATSREGGERLPVVMDDILVNSDTARRRAAVETILEIAEHQQVLYFTCHDQTVEAFRAARPDVPVITLSDGRIV